MRGSKDHSISAKVLFLPLFVKASCQVLIFVLECFVSFLVWYIRADEHDEGTMSNMIK